VRAGLLLTCLVYFLFASTIYMGTLWCLRLFLYPSWVGLTPDNVGVHFVGPTHRATKFFTVVVLLMIPAGVGLIIGSWGTNLVWVTSVAVLGIVASTVVGTFMILPVNKRIAKGVGAAELTALLKRWMVLNDIRWVTTTIMWSATVWYAVAIGDAYAALK
jgi:hypothetical protein